MILPYLAGRSCVVVGSAPLEAPLSTDNGELVVAVNGGISSTPRVDAWVLNSRNLDTAAWSPTARAYALTMLRQGAGRDVPLAVLLTKHDDADVWTLARLRKWGTTIRASIAIHNEQRRELEAAAHARNAAMRKEALSAGFFAAAFCFLNGAADVRLEGMSWRPGYAYETPAPYPYRTRGHVVADQWALALLLQHYGDRLRHRLPIPALVHRLERERARRLTQQERTA